MATPTRKSDVSKNLLHPLGVEPGLGRLREERDHGRHVEQMMRQLLLTDFGERAMCPEFGAGVRRMVFAPLGDISASLVKASVFSALDRWLGDLIEVEAVSVRTEEETVHLRVVYRLKTGPGRRVLNLETSV
jgi:phage baseplate assembly protein W